MFIFQSICDSIRLEIQKERELDVSRNGNNENELWAPVVARPLFFEFWDGLLDRVMTIWENNPSKESEKSTDCFDGSNPEKWHFRFNFKNNLKQSGFQSRKIETGIQSSKISFFWQSSKITLQKWRLGSCNVDLYDFCYQILPDHLHNLRNGVLVSLANKFFPTSKKWIKRYWRLYPVLATLAVTSRNVHGFPELKNCLLAIGGAESADFPGVDSQCLILISDVTSV